MRRVAVGLLVALAAIAVACSERPSALGGTSDTGQEGSVDVPVVEGVPVAPPMGPCTGTALCLESLAGGIGGSGNADGIGETARFSGPQNVAFDSVGNLYVSDRGNNTVRKITPSGVVTTLAGVAGVAGSADGNGSAAQFYSPAGLGLDGADNIYVADSNNGTVRKITPDGTVTTLAGLAGAYATVDGTGSAARFAGPLGLTVDAAGDVYVTDSDDIREITPDGVVTTVAGVPGDRGSTDGTGSGALFMDLSGLGIDTQGDLYIVDNNTIRVMTPEFVVTTIAGSPGVNQYVDGPGSAARFFAPSSLVVDASGYVYITDGAVRMLDPAGYVSTVAQPSALGAYGQTTVIDEGGGPAGIAEDASGNLFIADDFNNFILKVTTEEVVSIFAGAADQHPGGVYGKADGVGEFAHFIWPTDMALDPAGNVYVSENGTVCLVTPAGVVTTIAGDPSGGYNGLAINGSNTMYLVDTGDYVIDEVTFAGHETTIAGTDEDFGSADGTGSAARFKSPIGIAVDSAGNAYITDAGNNTIREMTPAGVVTTFVGATGSAGSADGSGSAAQFNNPEGIAIDGAGNLYVTDMGNSTVRKITPAGVVSTLAGTAGVIGSADGTGSAASFNQPQGVAVDGAGNVYVVDTRNSTIRVITPAGVVSTLVGTPGLIGIKLGTSPELAFPRYVAISGHALVITDTDAILLLQNAVP
jgi:sugar lactone lactonase YvrE